MQTKKEVEESGLSPIDEAIKRVDSLNGANLCEKTIGYIRGMILSNLRPYERQYLRDVAENACKEMIFNPIQYSR